jgi:hypothetical protein
MSEGKKSELDEMMDRLGIGPTTTFRELELIARRAAREAGKAFAAAMLEMHPHLTQHELDEIARKHTQLINKVGPARR